MVLIICCLFHPEKLVSNVSERTVQYFDVLFITKNQFDFNQIFLSAFVHTLIKKVLFLMAVLCYRFKERMCLGGNY